VPSLCSVYRGHPGWVGSLLINTLDYSLVPGYLVAIGTLGLLILGIYHHATKESNRTAQGRQC